MHRLPGNHHNPPGNDPHINTFKNMMAINSRLRLLIGGVTLVAGPAFGQTPNPTPTPRVPADSVPGQIAPGANPTAPAESLSEKLNQSDGVIHPKEVDPAIEKPAPQARETSGGAPAPKPK
jgi:hypothetical protein